MESEVKIMLEIYNLTKKYGKFTAVDHVNFIVPSGRVGILLGPNGAGKSTIIKSVANLLRYEGEVKINQLDSHTLEAKRIFAYVPEMPFMYDALTVAEHLEFIEKAYNLETSIEYKEELLDRFELLDKKDKLGNELSKGMMQKVSICCAMLIKPQVILLDEPMVGLDPKAIKVLKEMILELKEQGATVLISTHMLEMVKELWDILFIMEKGKIVASFGKDESQEQDIEKLFFEITGGDKE